MQKGTRRVTAMGHSGRRRSLSASAVAPPISRAQPSWLAAKLFRSLDGSSISIWLIVLWSRMALLDATGVFEVSAVAGSWSVIWRRRSLAGPNVIALALKSRDKNDWAHSWHLPTFSRSPF